MSPLAARLSGSVEVVILEHMLGLPKRTCDFVMQERIDSPTQVLIIPTALPRIEDHWSPCRISAVNLEDN